MRVVPVRHYGQWIVTVVMLVLAALLVQSLLTNPRFQWNIVFGYFLNGQILKGLGTTIALTVIAMVVGVVIGVVMALGRESRNPVVAAAASLYVGFFRGTPLLVQLIFWFNLGVLFQNITIGVPFGPTLFSIETNDLITPLTAALLGLGLNEGAYMSEVVRGGVLSVDGGQIEAARALGMSKGKTLRVVVLPQALRIIIPPTGNELIGLLKTTSLASVISFTELVGASSRIYSANLKVLELLVVVSIWYLAITSVLSVGQYYLERRLAAGSGLQSAPTLGQVIRDGILGRRARSLRGSAHNNPGTGEEQR